MIKEKTMMETMNNQINEELYSSYLYMAMSAHFAHEGWEGMAKWMMAQAKEEEVHAMKFYHHILGRGGKVELKAIAKPPVKWGSPVEIFRESLKHEEYITGKIHNMMKLAIEENDFAAEGLLQWFVDEQVEEEASVSQVLLTMERIGGKGPAMVMMDHQLGKRE